jgi:hypothetical protein
VLDHSVDRRRLPKPKGYIGRNHETKGTSIAALLESLEALIGGDVQRRNALISKVLTAEQLQVFRSLDPQGWYPIELAIALMEAVDRNVGRYALMRMGRLLFRRSHQERELPTATCGYDIVHSLDRMYLQTNRGDRIGGWRVLRFDDGGAELEKTTPHHCSMEEGLLAQALSAVGGRAVISQKVCIREGDDRCHFVIHSAGGRWSRSEER